MTTGPAISLLIHHLQQCPSVFLAHPACTENPTGVHTAAIISDVLLKKGQASLSKAEAAQLHLADEKIHREYLGIIQLVCWVVNGPGLDAAVVTAKLRDCLFHEWWIKLAHQVDHREFYRNSLRREELVRVTCHLLGIQPEGETENFSLDRLMTLDSLEENLILEQTRAARERVLSIRKALAKKAAEEAASKMSRE